MKEYLTFDDVLIAPSYSEIETRETINTTPYFLNLGMTVPIISANMDYVTGSDMAIAMWEAGGLGILNRFMPLVDQLEAGRKITEGNAPLFISVGIRDYPMTTITDFYDLFPHMGVCIDVAHGDHGKVVTLTRTIKSKWPKMKVIAGNVATVDGFRHLAQAGADAIKVGIGPGSVCTTRVVTGVGVPQLSAILEIAARRNDSYPTTAIIADGGIKNSGDIAKAIGAGADVVMLGHLLAGTTEAPGAIIQAGDGRAYKPYRGQSIFGTNGLREVPEGISGFVEEKGPVGQVVKRLNGGLKSAMSYVGANSIREFQNTCEFIKVTPMSLTENGTRVQQHV